ncbi:hypothetical protein [Weissella viridescens]|nr:hypothetical protein [Weissella viridescens]WJI90911.1 hypothetical protein PWA48_06205 [Weissella viridescens]
MSETITNESFQDLIDDLTVDGPVVGEKKFAIDNFFQLKDPEGQTTEFSHIDILRRADETFWMPLETDRHTITNITDYEIFINKSEKWVPIKDWFETEEI